MSETDELALACKLRLAVDNPNDPDFNFSRRELTDLFGCLTSLRADNARLVGELTEANHWRDRHCADAKAYGEQSQKNWADLQRHKEALEKARVALQHIYNWKRDALPKHALMISDSEDALRHINEVLKGETTEPSEAEQLLLDIAKQDGWLRTDDTRELWERLQKWKEKQ